MARTAKRCRTCSDKALTRRFDDLVRPLGRESHWLRTTPEAAAPAATA